jgi:hypothetical protein
VWADGVEVSAADMRSQVLGAMSRPGTVRGDPITALPTPAMAVRVPARLEYVDDGQLGLYGLELLAQTDLDIGASDASLPRIDSVIAEVVDNGDATTIRRFRVVAGTPAASPTAPALPYADQPTARTRRLADVRVRANAEANGFIRATDVTYYDVPAVPRPVENSQINTPPANTMAAAQWIRFTSAQWPSLQVLIPPSEIVMVTVSAEVANYHSDTSTMRVGVDLVHEPSGLSIDSALNHSVCGNRTVQGSRRFKTTWDGLAGEVLTAYPTWRASSQPDNSQGFVLQFGQLLLEPEL